MINNVFDIEVPSQAYSQFWFRNWAIPKKKQNKRLGGKKGGFEDIPF